MNDYKTVVLGATTNPQRYAYRAVEQLQEHGIETIPVGIRKGSTAGIPIRNDRPTIAAVHTITLYLNAQVQQEYYDYILSLKPKRVIFNPGTENPELYGLLKKELPETIIEIACTLVLLSVGSYKTVLNRPENIKQD
ncbi:CoA-binding protein [Aureispira anguillae]|uniref:CoA-binding protein n=1 Tax=Aureispira anguillae TaxID=2864201 RepID=A0A915YI33_9BACT|nr:CoA-binding protein [Aureispira anguillae]BDS13478.1 CoA-binding protein [Aureispira anguillae]